MKEEYEAEKKLSIERITLEAQVYDSIKGYAYQYAEAQEKLIEERIKQMRKAGVDEVAIAAYTREETYKIEQKKLLDSGEFFNGVRAGYLEMTHNEMTWAQSGKEIFTEIFGPTGAVTKTTETFFVDLFKGQLKTAEDYFNLFKDAVIASIAQMIAKWVAFTAMTAVGNWIFGPDWQGIKGPASPATGLFSMGAKAAYNYVAGLFGEEVAGEMTAAQLNAMYGFNVEGSIIAGSAAEAAVATEAGMTAAEVAGMYGAGSGFAGGAGAAGAGTFATGTGGGLGAIGAAWPVAAFAAAWMLGMNAITSRAPTLIAQAPFNPSFRSATGISTLLAEDALYRAFDKAGMSDAHLALLAMPQAWMDVNGESFKAALDIAREYTPEKMNMITGTFNPGMTYSAAWGSPMFTGMINRIYRAIVDANQTAIVPAGYVPRYFINSAGAIEEITDAAGAAGGGIIDELIIGRGQRTGTKYYFGEAGPERITPLKGAGFSESNISELIDEVRGMRAEMQKVTKNTGKTAKILDRFDGDGMPAERSLV